VTQWLSENGLESTPVSAAGDWIAFSVPVAKANELLKADFSVFTHTASGQQSIRTLEYSIPALLQAHIKLVTPTTS
jgi:tripeptidyl-peptidase-1